MSKKSSKDNSNQYKKTSFENLSTEQLKAVLKQLQSQHDIMQAKNQQLSSHVTDLRSVIKKVEKQRSEQLDFMLQKKKKLLDEIDRCEAALKVTNSNNTTMHSDMIAFKSLEGND